MLCLRRIPLSVEGLMLSLRANQACERSCLRSSLQISSPMCIIVKMCFALRLPKKRLLNKKKNVGISTHCLSRTFRLWYCRPSEDKQCRSPRCMYLKVIQYTPIGINHCLTVRKIFEFTRFECAADKTSVNVFLLCLFLFLICQFGIENFTKLD